MPEAQRTATHSQTLVVDAETFSFETLEQENGQATVIRFPIDESRYYAGDVLLAGTARAPSRSYANWIPSASKRSFTAKFISCIPARYFS